tara:strand:- start:450 stop:887 length:438 start_codon:yes stop_codon:yes gene_type:complete
MIGLIQRVSEAKVTIDSEVAGKIDRGILLLLGVEKDDDEAKAKKLFERVLNYRIFSDQDGKMNLNLKQVGGGLLVVSQFTLVAQTNKGNRPGFSQGASPELGEALYNYFVKLGESSEVCCQTGKFGANMQVSLVNDGPVTFSLQV